MEIAGILIIAWIQQQPPGRTAPSVAQARPIIESEAGGRNKRPKFMTHRRRTENSPHENYVDEW